MSSTISDGKTVLSVGEVEPKPFGKYPLISERIRDGEFLHGFRSGGGLRVLYFVEKEERSNPGYGEHPYVEQAMDILEEDLAAGGRDWHDVYGKIHPHFVTGSSEPSSEVDRWIMAGKEFDIGYYINTFVFISHWMEGAVPRDVYTQVTLSRVPVCYVDERGYIFAIIPSKFPNGEECSSGSIVKPSWEECRRMGVSNPFEIKREIWIEDETLEGLLAKMEVELPKYWRQ